MVHSHVIVIGHTTQMPASESANVGQAPHASVFTSVLWGWHYLLPRLPWVYRGNPKCYVYHRTRHKSSVRGGDE